METSRKSTKVLVYVALMAAVLFASVFTFTGSVYAQDNQPTATPQAGQNGSGSTTSGQSGSVPVTGESEYFSRDIRVLTQAEKTRDYTKYGAEQQGQEECGQSYAVAPGEYWSLIVVNCDVPLDKLLAANPQVHDQNFLFAGEVLNIPDGSFSEIYAPRSGMPYVVAPRTANNNVPVTGSSNNQSGSGVSAQPTATVAAGTGALPTATVAAGTGVLPTATVAAGDTSAQPTATVAAGTGTDTSVQPTATVAAGTGTDTSAQPTATQAAGSTGSTVGNNGSVPVTGDAMAAAFARADIRKLTMAEKNRDYTKYDEKQQGQDECGSEYVVARGESWSLIVVNCDVPLDVLLRANGQQDSSILFAGQVINIPSGSFKEITAPTSGLPYAVIPGWQGVRVFEDQNNNGQVVPSVVPTGVGDVTPVPTMVLETPAGPIGTPIGTVEVPVVTPVP